MWAALGTQGSDLSRLWNKDVTLGVLRPAAGMSKPGLPPGVLSPLGVTL